MPLSLPRTHIRGEALLANGTTAPGQLYAMGGSAGGLLMGAVVNMRPDLWKGVIAGVPFVDVINTMLDASIPLTTSEYDEWVAKLRDVHRGNNKIYLVTDMEAGHGGKSGRYNALKDDALEFAFLLDLAGIKP